MKNRIIILISIMMLILVSCSEQRLAARRFVKQNQNTVVALYLPGRLIKQNLREDEMPEILEDSTLQVQIDYMESLICVVNKIDDDEFLDIVYEQMKETLEDYGLTVEYWESENSVPDSTHWVFNIPRIEVVEMNEYQEYCEWVYDYKFCADVPVDLVNVAAWFEFMADTTATMAYTEQNYFSKTDVAFEFDIKSNKVYTKSYIDKINIDGFYRFASMLGKLYAGYCYDYMLNKYVDNNTSSRSDTINKFRYDPYERYLYQTPRDYLIEMK